MKFSHKHLPGGAGDPESQVGAAFDAALGGADESSVATPSSTCSPAPPLERGNGTMKTKALGSKKGLAI